MSQIKEEVPESPKETILQDDEEEDSKENAADPEDRLEEEITTTSTSENEYNQNHRFCSPANRKCRLICAVLIAVVFGLVFVFVFTSSSDTVDTSSAGIGNEGEGEEGSDEQPRTTAPAPATTNMTDAPAQEGTTNNMTDAPAQVPSCPPVEVENEAIYSWSETAIFVDYEDSLTEEVTTVFGSTNNTDSLGRLPDVDEIEIVNKFECTSDVGSPAQWFKLSPQEPGTKIYLWTCSPQTQFDTVINVYRSTTTTTTSGQEGGGCSTTTSSLECMGSNDDHTMTDLSNVCASTPRQSAMTITSLYANDTIYIAVSGKDSTEFGDFELLLSSEPPPPLIEEDPPEPLLPATSCPFENAVPFNYYDGVTFTGSTFYSEPTLPSIDGCSLNTGSNVYWFQFEPEEIGIFLVETCNDRTDFDTVITVFKKQEGITALEGTQGCDQVTCIASNDDHLFEDTGNSLLCSSHQHHSALEVVSETEEDVFYVALSGFSNIDAGTFVIRFTDITPATITEEGCVLDTATPIGYLPTAESATTEILGSTVGATSTLPSSLDICGTYSVGSPTVWYYFETAAAAKFLITTCHPNTDFDTVISVYQPLQQQNSQQQQHCNIHCLAVNDDDRDNTPQLCTSMEGNNRLRSAVEIISQPPLSRFYIAVSGARADRSGDFVLSITEVPMS